MSGEIGYVLNVTFRRLVVHVAAYLAGDAVGRCNRNSLRSLYLPGASGRISIEPRRGP